jgi:hypothetical protein
MATKVITKDCKKCELKRIMDGDEICTWGNSKSVKRLRSPLGKKKHCRLIAAVEQIDQQMPEVAIL